MRRNLIFISGNEFVEKILSGERDFQNLRLEPGFNLSMHESYKDLNIRQKFVSVKTNPYLISGSSFLFLNAELDWSYAIGKNTSFYGANLNKSDFRHSILQGSDFTHTNLEHSNFYRANLRHSRFDYSNLQNASFNYASLNGVSFQSSYLRDANLGNAKLKYVNFKDANLTFASLMNADLDCAHFNNTNLSLTTLENAKNLDKVSNLNWALYHFTRVSIEGKKIIEQKLKEYSKLLVQP